MLSIFLKNRCGHPIACVLLLLLALQSNGFAGERNIQTGRIVVEVSGLRNSSGEVIVRLYNSREGFPSAPEKALITLAGKIEDSRARVVFEDIPFGAYAVSVFHDENGNKEMDMSWLMMPKEGVGASNNPKGSLGPPSFDDAEFKLDTGEVAIRIIISY